MIGFRLPGGSFIPAFGVVLGLGASLGLAWMLWKRRPQERSAQLNAGLCLLAGCLVGARAGEVVVNWDYYRLHLPQLFSLSLAGFTWLGAIAGGTMAFLGYAWFSRSGAGWLADAMIPLATCLWVSAWMACWLDGCAYGPAANAWWALPVRDEWGVVSSRLPLQLIGALLVLGFSALLEREARPGWPPGFLASLWLAINGLLALLLSFFRVDPGLLAAGLRLDTWGSAGVALAGLIVGLALYRFRKIV